MAPHSSTLAWKIPWTEEPGRIAKSRTQLSNFTFTFHFHALEKEMPTHSSVIAWRIPGMGEPVGLPSIGSHRVRHDRSNLAAAAALVAQLCLTLYDPMVFSLLSHICLFVTHGLQPARLLCPQNSSCKNTRMDCHSLLQTIFQAYCRQILYFLSHQEALFPPHTQNQNYCNVLLLLYSHLKSLMVFLSFLPHIGYLVFIC